MATVPRRPAAQQERERLQARRLCAAELFASGVRQAEVARQLEVSAQAVSVWHARWQAGGIAALRGRGVTRVALVGASMGGSAALIAATRVQPPVNAVVELSGEADLTSQLGIPLNAGAAVAQLAVPAMFMVANYDAYTTVEETRAMHQAAKTADKRLEVLPSKFDGMHGWGMLTDVSSGGVSSAATTVAEFVAAHTGS